MNLKLNHIVVILALTMIYFSCVKKKSYSKNPEIEFKDFYPYSGDTADLLITFSDGDGDIGKEQEDATKNLFITYNYFDTITGKFHAYYQPLLLDTVRMNYTIRKPNGEYAGKPISGEIAVRINEYRPSKKHKRIKYIMYLVDNAGNSSNILTTPELLVP